MSTLGQVVTVTIWAMFVTAVLYASRRTIAAYASTVVRGCKR